jgi:hypothetical protein
MMSSCQPTRVVAVLAILLALHARAVSAGVVGDQEHQNNNLGEDY